MKTVRTKNILYYMAMRLAYETGLSYDDGIILSEHFVTNSKKLHDLPLSPELLLAAMAGVKEVADYINSGGRVVSPSIREHLGRN